MLVAFLGLVAGLKWPVGLALAATSVVVAVADGQGFPLRHLVEGMFGYLDVSLVLITAMIFMKIIERNGLLDALGAPGQIGVAQSTLGRTAVRQIETLYIAGLMKEWTDELVEAVKSGDSEYFREPATITGAGSGFGLGGGAGAQAPSEADLAEIQKLFGKR